MTAPFPAQIFREYDVRGDADKHLSSGLFRNIGRAYAALVRKAQGSAQGSARLTVALGRDCRLSSPRLHAALLDGLLAGGLDVVDVGIGPTPMLYFAVHHLEVFGGLMITGSHNPGHENGVKMLRRSGSIYGAEIQELRASIESGTLTDTARGTLSHRDVQDDYAQYMKKNLRLARTDLKFVVDAGNGSAGPLAIRAMKALGLSPVELFTDMDGTFPNHHPDPTQPENVAALIAKVKETGAEVGIAYDGDGDRLGAIDADGTIVWGDKLLTLFAREILRETPGAAIIGEVKCSQTLYDDVARHGGRPITWKTGHSLIKAKMKEEHALLAGEMSGHLFFADRYFGYDDAIYASLRLLEILAGTRQTIGALLADLPRTFVTPEIRVDCPDAVKFDVVAEVRARFEEALGKDKVLSIDGARILFEHGWGLVRASNTQAALVVRFEADTEARRDDYRQQVETAIATARRRLGA
ncbi:MAG: phosphomannomutase/phosphoglucomutase [Polyangiales bacterium]